MKKLMMVLCALCFVPCAAWAATIDVTQANIGQNRTLMGGNTYRFAENVTYNAAATESALQVANSATVTLVVPAGVTVTLKGGDANGTTGAGAGIEVPDRPTAARTA